MNVQFRWAPKANQNNILIFYLNTFSVFGSDISELWEGLMQPRYPEQYLEQIQFDSSFNVEKKNLEQYPLTFKVLSFKGRRIQSY